MTRIQLITLLKTQGVKPEDLFTEADNKEKAALAKLIHPDTYKDPEAAELTQKLFELFDRAQARKASGSFGSPWKFDKPIVMSSDKHKFTLVSRFGETQSFLVFEKHDNGLLFLVKNLKENVNGKQYNESIGKLNEVPKVYPKLQYIGKYSDSRDIYELDTLKGYYPLSRLLGKDVPVRHLAWMINRLVMHTCYYDAYNMIHTNLNPDTLLINPEHHKMVVIGIESMVSNKRKVAHRKPTAYMAPEQSTGAVNSSTDLYAVAKIIETFASPVWTTKEKAALTPVINAFTKLAPSFRTVTANQLEKRLLKVWEDLYGPPAWQDFAKLNIRID